MIREVGAITKQIAKAEGPLLKMAAAKDNPPDPGQFTVYVLKRGWPYVYFLYGGQGRSRQYSCSILKKK